MSTQNKTPHAGGVTGLNKTQQGNSITAQQRRILDALGNAPLTTFQARRDLDIAHPAGRIMELRQQGHTILTHWGNDYSEAGRRHRVARYVLRARLGDG